MINSAKIKDFDIKYVEKLTKVKLKLRTQIKKDIKAYNYQNLTWEPANL